MRLRTLHPGTGKVSPVRLSPSQLERIQELHALGCTDPDIARAMGVYDQLIRGARNKLNLKINYVQKLRFNGLCIACGAECVPLYPICRPCFMLLPTHRRLSLQQLVKAGLREESIRTAQRYVTHARKAQVTT